MPPNREDHHDRSLFLEALHLLICGGGILLCYFYFGIQQEQMYVYSLCDSDCLLVFKENMTMERSSHLPKHWFSLYVLPIRFLHMHFDQEGM